MNNSLIIPLNPPLEKEHLKNRCQLEISPIITIKFTGHNAAFLCKF
jgi:hypothetical protein